MRQGQLRAVLGYLHRVANPDGGGPDDAQLLDRWRRHRDPAAFELLVWRHGGMVWNVCRRVLGRSQDVEDAFQATFLTFLRKLDTIGQGRFLATWLYKVAFRTALAVRAARARHAGLQELPADVPEAAATREPGWGELGPVLDEEVNRLPEKYRLPFVLCYLEGKTTDEAARDLGCPRGTVGTRLAWARQRLRARLSRRGMALSAPGLSALLAEKAAAAIVPAPLVASVVQAATLSVVGKAVAAGVVSARAAALSRGVLHAMFVARVKTVAVVLLVVGILGNGTGLLVHQTLTARTAETQTVAQRQPAFRPDEGVFPPLPPEQQVRGGADEDHWPLIEEDAAPAAPDPGVKEFGPPQFAAMVLRVDPDGKRLLLELRSKAEGSASQKEITLTDRTQLVFSNVGPNEARLTKGYGAEVWLEKDSPDVAARVRLNGTRNSKKAPHRVGQVVGVADGEQGFTLSRPAKGEPAEQFAVRFTDRTRLVFSDVARGGATITAGYEARVWSDGDAPESAKSVTFLGNAEGKPAAGKEPKADRVGRIVGLSGDGTVLTVELHPTKGPGPTRTEIRLTEATRESYHGVAANGANPAEGDLVQVWLAEGSADTAARVRFVRPDPRRSIDGRIAAVSEDGSRVTVAVAPGVKDGEPVRRDILITAQTDLVFANVGPGSARLTEGDRVRGWLAEGSEDLADELLVSRSEKIDDRKPVEKR
jgi:RNA polymerase sigma factor (sigma-70 family)